VFDIERMSAGVNRCLIDELQNSANQQGQSNEWE